MAQLAAEGLSHNLNYKGTKAHEGFILQNLLRAPCCTMTVFRPI
jgi:hypothetical protein